MVSYAVVTTGKVTCRIEHTGSRKENELRSIVIV